MSKARAEPITELTCNPSTPVDGLSAVVPLGTSTHLIFTVRQPDIDGRIVRIVQARLVVPTEQLQAIGRVMLSGRLDLQETSDENGEPAALH
jgi:hypothetical protein